jgi:hypothetical protein
VAGSCEYGDGPSGSGATELVSLFVSVHWVTPNLTADFCCITSSNYAVRCTKIYFTQNVVISEISMPNWKYFTLCLNFSERNDLTRSLLDA